MSRGYSPKETATRVGLAETIQLIDQVAGDEFAEMVDGLTSLQRVLTNNFRTTHQRFIVPMAMFVAELDKSTVPPLYRKFAGMPRHILKSALVAHREVLDGTIESIHGVLTDNAGLVIARNYYSSRGRLQVGDRLVTDVKVSVPEFDVDSPGRVLGLIAYSGSIALGNSGVDGGAPQADLSRIRDRELREAVMAEYVDVTIRQEENEGKS